MRALFTAAVALSLPLLAHAQDDKFVVLDKFCSAIMSADEDERPSLHGATPDEACACLRSTFEMAPETDSASALELLEQLDAAVGGLESADMQAIEEAGDRIFAKLRTKDEASLEAAEAVFDTFETRLESGECQSFDTTPVALPAEAMLAPEDADRVAGLCTVMGRDPYIRMELADEDVGIEALCGCVVHMFEAAPSGLSRDALDGLAYMEDRLGPLAELSGPVVEREVERVEEAYYDAEYAGDLTTERIRQQRRYRAVGDIINAGQEAFDGGHACRRRDTD